MGALDLPGQLMLAGDLRLDAETVFAPGTAQRQFRRTLQGEAVAAPPGQTSGDQGARRRRLAGGLCSGNEHKPLQFFRFHQPIHEMIRQAQLGKSRYCCRQTPEEKGELARHILCGGHPILDAVVAIPDGSAAGRSVQVARLRLFFPGGRVHPFFDEFQRQRVQHGGYFLPAFRGDGHQFLVRARAAFQPPVAGKEQQIGKIVIGQHNTYRDVKVTVFWVELQALVAAATSPPAMTPLFTVSDSHASGWKRASFVHSDCGTLVRLMEKDAPLSVDAMVTSPPQGLEILPPLSIEVGAILLAITRLLSNPL